LEERQNRKIREMELKRKPFQGVLNILDFNRHFYYYGIAALAIILLIIYFTQLPTILSVLILLGFAYGLLMPLIISAYVYDYSGYYEFDWMDTIVSPKADKLSLVNIHAGFDETSHTIKNKFPNADLAVFDFYEQENHTEAAIVRARNISQFYPGTKNIKSNHIPVHDDRVDVLFLLSTVHEIRNHNEKVEFLKECSRVLKDNGKLLVVEHLRDTPNFLAFTIGFTHFFSKMVWLDAFNKAGFNNVAEKKFTPFMSIFECKI